MLRPCFSLVLMVSWMASAGLFAQEKEAPPTVPQPTPENSDVSSKSRMLLLDLNASLIDEKAVKIITNMVSSELDTYKKFSLITSADVKQMIALESEKQTMGCANDDSCLAEIAGAMGARYVIYGEVGQLGSNIIVTLNVFDSVKAESAGRVTSTVKGLDALPEQVPLLVSELMQELLGESAVPAKQAVAPVPEKVPAEKSMPAKEKPTDQAANMSHFPWIRLSVAVGTAVVGGLAAALYGWPAYDSMITAQKAYQPLKDVDTQEAAELFDAAETSQANYMGGPVYGMLGGGLLALAGASYALYVTGDALSKGE